MTDHRDDMHWDGWKPAWDDKKGVHRSQEKHSPTENVTVKLSSERQMQTSRRRVADARLWNALSPAEQDAACAIVFAFETMGRGLGYVVSDLTKIKGCRSLNVAEAQSRMIAEYISWCEACAKQKISHSLIIDVLVFGFSCRAVDQDRRTRRGHTRQNLLDGLALYAKLKGWK